MKIARADGNLHPSELAFIMAIINEYRINASAFQHLGKESYNSLINKVNNKSEFLYLALKLIQVDNQIAHKELSFCRNMALRLGFKPAVIDHFADKELDDPKDFKTQLGDWLI
ncbi:MAG: hypothetical protein AAF693_19025 [Bacteroidota bacterium]